MRKCYQNYVTLEKKKERKKRADRASLKIYMKMKRYIKRSGAQIYSTEEDGINKQMHSR